MELDAVHTTTRVLLAVGMYAGLAALGLWADTLMLWCAVWIGMGFAMLSAGAAMHEGVHRLLYRSRWLNDLVGGFGAGVLLIPFEVYRRLHIAHHRSVSTPEDPEPRGTYTSFIQWLVLAFISTPLYIGLFWFHGLRAVAGRPPAFLRASGARRAVAINLGCLGAWIAATIAATFAWPSLVFHLYWAPLLYTWIVLVTLVTVPEHYGCRLGPASPFVTTRTTTSNAILSYFFWNTNYHAAHHVHAGVPSRRLPELHEVIKERCQFVEPSFFAWHARLVGNLLRRTPVSARQAST